MSSWEVELAVVETVDTFLQFKKIVVITLVSVQTKVL